MHADGGDGLHSRPKLSTDHVTRKFHPDAWDTKPWWWVRDDIDRKKRELEKGQLSPGRNRRQRFNCGGEG